MVRHLLPDKTFLGHVDYCARSSIAIKALKTSSSGGSSSSNSSSSSDARMQQIKFYLSRMFLSPTRTSFAAAQLTSSLETWRKEIVGHDELRSKGFHFPDAKTNKMRIACLGDSGEGVIAKFLLQNFPNVDLTIVDSSMTSSSIGYNNCVWNLQLTGHMDAVQILAWDIPTACRRMAHDKSTKFDFVLLNCRDVMRLSFHDLTLVYQCLADNGLLLINDAVGSPERQQAINTFLASVPHRRLAHSGGKEVLILKSSTSNNVKDLISADEADEVVSSTSSSLLPVSNAISSSSSSSSATGVVAILLPLTSRDSNLADFKRSLLELESCLPLPPSCVIMIGIDEDDELLNGESGKTLLNEVFNQYISAGRMMCHYYPSTKPAKICSIVKDVAKRAYQLSDELTCEYFVLLGDDVSIQPKRCWMKAVVASFQLLHKRVAARFGLSKSGLPFGFGVVALPDVTFKGFPTFPVVSRCHMQLFNGQLWPDEFINQDADPFLWALYRPFEARIFAENVALKNKIGGDAHQPTRYQRVHVDWKHKLLKTGITTIQTWLNNLHHSTAVASGADDDYSDEEVDGDSSTSPLLVVHQHSIITQQRVTLDVIVPTYRGIRSILHGILSLTAPPEADVTFIVIVDDPAHKTLRQDLEATFAERQLIVRMNEENLGASASRNRGIEESSADWVLFLDDDVLPDPWILHRYVEAIIKDGHRAAGFVGLSALPQPTTYLTAGLTMSYLTYFWRVAEIAAGGEEAPWAVTANVLSRRPRHARFNLDFLKTGGGEDILFLRHVMAEFELPLLKAPSASIVHPWWDENQPSPWRFYRWSASDSLLMDDDKQPQHAFYSAPHVVEMSVLVMVFAFPLLVYFCDSTVYDAIYRSILILSLLWCVEFSFSIFQLMWVDPSHVAKVIGWRRVLCAMIACVYTNFAEVGHTWAPLRRGRLKLFSKRVDWWYGLNAGYKTDRVRQESIKFAVFVAVIAVNLFDSLRCFFVFCLMLMSLFSLVLVIVFKRPINSSPFTAHSVPSSCVKGDSIKQLPLQQSTLKPMHVVFICDSNYIGALAVTIHSLLEHHFNDEPDAGTLRMHLHVLDIGIKDDDWNNLVAMVQQLEPHDHDSCITVHRHSTAADSYLDMSLARYPARVKHDWSLWSKLFLDVLLPDVDQVIYLDCDLLIRDSLVNLWKMLLNDADSSSPTEIFAVRDAGVPCGHPSLCKFGWLSNGVKAHHYFNAGVMLLNLQQWRHHRIGQCLRGFAREFAASDCLIHAEQDVLNLVFRSIQRKAVIVHFTGSANPPLWKALCEYVKSPSKPWCYFCHHPLVKEWYRVLQRTPFLHSFDAATVATSCSSSFVSNFELQQLQSSLYEEWRLLQLRLNLPLEMIQLAVQQASNRLV